jgi:uncharacterized protein YjcR
MGLIGRQKKKENRKLNSQLQAQRGRNQIMMTKNARTNNPINEPASSPNSFTKDTKNKFLNCGTKH